MTPDEICGTADGLVNALVACRWAGEECERVFRVVFVDPERRELGMCGTGPENPCFLVRADRLTSIRAATDED